MLKLGSFFNLSNCHAWYTIRFSTVCLTLSFIGRYRVILKFTQVLKLDFSGRYSHFKLHLRPTFDLCSRALPFLTLTSASEDDDQAVVYVPGEVTSWFRSVLNHHVIIRVAQFPFTIVTAGCHSQMRWFHRSPCTVSFYVSFSWNWYHLEFAIMQKKYVYIVSSYYSAFLFW